MFKVIIEEQKDGSFRATAGNVITVYQSLKDMDLEALKKVHDYRNKEALENDLSTFLQELLGAPRDL